MLRPVVKDRRVEVGAIGPDKRVSFVIDRHSVELIEIAQRAVELAPLLIPCLLATARPIIGGMGYRDRIVIDPEVRFGKPCVRGTRITVGDVLSYLASGMSEQEILADFPQLTRDDIRACLAFAAERERRIVSSPAA